MSIFGLFCSHSPDRCLTPLLKPTASHFTSSTSYFKIYTRVTVDVELIQEIPLKLKDCARNGRFTVLHVNFLCSFLHHGAFTVCTLYTERTRKDRIWWGIDAFSITEEHFPSCLWCFDLIQQTLYSPPLDLSDQSEAQSRPKREDVELSHRPRHQCHTDRGGGWQVWHTVTVLKYSEVEALIPHFNTSLQVKVQRKVKVLPRKKYWN